MIPIAAVATLVLLPMLILGIIAAHSSPYSISWATQFAEQVRDGILYPRWLADSFDGLGAPTFYFYPPLVFWLDAVVSIVTMNGLSVEYRLAVVSLLILLAAGFSMCAWLRGEGASLRASQVGAIAYVIAPYHVLDIYVRGALAESATYAVLPMIFLAIRLIAEKRAMGPALLAVSYAALVMTHLPTALLATMTLIPAYVLFRAWRLGRARPAIEMLLRSVIAGILGGGLSALYLVPALSLRDWIAADVWEAPYNNPLSWLVLAPESWIEPPPHPVMAMISSMALSAALAAAGLMLALLLVDGVSRRWEAAFWAAIALLTLVLLAGLVPAIWATPWLALAQFPWRLMVLVELAVITGCCIACAQPLNTRGLLRRAILVFAAVTFLGAATALVPGLKRLIAQVAIHIQYTISHAQLPRYEAVEYVPRGFDQASATLKGIPTRNLGLVQSVPLITCAPVATVCAARQGRLGTLDAIVESEAPTRVTLRRFAFPAWRLDPETAIGSSDELKLVSFVVPAGRTSLHVSRATLSAEKWGAAVSTLSLCLLIAMVAFGMRATR